MEKLLTNKQVAEILSINPLTLASFARLGKIKGLQIGRSWRYRREDVDEYINSKLKDQSGAV